MVAISHFIKRKEVEKVINFRFSLCVHSLLHIDTEVLTNHVDKMGKL